MFTNANAYVIGKANALDSKSPGCQHITAAAAHGSALPWLAVVLQSRISFVNSQSKPNTNGLALLQLQNYMDLSVHAFFSHFRTRNARQAIPTLLAFRALVHVYVMHEVDVVQYRFHGESLVILCLVKLYLYKQ